MMITNVRFGRLSPRAEAAYQALETPAKPLPKVEWWDDFRVTREMNAVMKGADRFARRHDMPVDNVKVKLDPLRVIWGHAPKLSAEIAAAPPKGTLLAEATVTDFVGVKKSMANLGAEIGSKLQDLSVAHAHALLTRFRDRKPLLHDSLAEPLLQAATGNKFFKLPEEE